MNKKINIALFSPGWPLSAYPNGIVTYTQNIISGFDGDVMATIATANLEVGYSRDSILDLAQFHKGRNYGAKLCDKVLQIGIANESIGNVCRNYKARRDVIGIVDALHSLENKLDIIEIEESFGKAKYLVKEVNTPIVTRLHGPWFIIGQHLKLGAAKGYKYRVDTEGDAIKASHGITTPSLDVLNKVREYYDCPLVDAKVIPNPVSPVSEKNQWQYLPKSKQTILVVGRFDLVKGGDLAIEAFRIVASKNKEVELLFVGPDRGVTINEISYTFSSYIEAVIPEASIKNRIKFLGHCNVDEIMRLRQKATVTLVPSRYETFSMSLLEAIATGSPVVASDVGGMKEIIINDFNGLLSEPESPESMAKNILDLLDDPEKMKLMSKNAIKDSKERFSPEIVAKQTLDYYRTVIAKY